MHKIYMSMYPGSLSPASGIRMARLAACRRMWKTQIGIDRF